MCLSDAEDQGPSREAVIAISVVWPGDCPDTTVEGLLTVRSMVETTGTTNNARPLPRRDEDGRRGIAPPTATLGLSQRVPCLPDWEVRCNSSPRPLPQAVGLPRSSRLISK